MTMNGLMALILRYFTEFVYDVVVKTFTFVISSRDEFLVILVRRGGGYRPCDVGMGKMSVEYKL